MALLFMDSWDHYDFAALTSKWAFGGGDKTDTSAVGAFGRRSTNGFKYRSSGTVFVGNGHLLEKQLVSSGNTAIVGYAFKCVTPLSDSVNQSNSESSSTVLASIQNFGVTHVWLRLNADGTVSAMYGSTVLETSLVGVTQNVYTYIEVKVVIAAALAGSVIVRFNGSEILNVTGVTTQVGASATWTGVYLKQRNVAGGLNEWHIDDFYMSDGSGAAPWNDLLGDCRVDAVFPTAEGASSDWTPLTGTNNAAMVNEAVADGDTSYVTSVTAGHTDTYPVSDTPVVGAAPAGVQICLFVRKESAGLANLAPVVRHAGMNYPIAVPSPGTSYGISYAIFQTNPGTDLAWTEADFNAAEFGFTRMA